MEIVKKIYRNQHFWIIAILVLAAALRLYHLDYQSIWLDEIHTMIEASPEMSFKEFNDVIMAREGIPHLYFLFVRGFFEIFGYSTFVARLFSVVCGLGSIYAIFALGRVLFNKQAGLIAAALLAVNHFHIYYSQEARSYSMLLFFTLVSFYWLVRFINVPTIKNAVLLGVFAGLITHGHPIGLTVVAAQYLVVLFVLIATRPNERLRFFKYSFISGIAALIVFYPVLRIVTKVSTITSYWVGLPPPDVYTQMIFDFLGRSELTIFIFNFLFIYYAITLFRQKNTQSWTELRSNKMILSFIVLALWASVAFLVPLIRSYLAVPMIVSRYFINLLPVFILLAAIGSEQIKNFTVKYFVIGALVVLSLVDLFVVRDFYNRVTKTQFRETTAQVLKQNVDNEKVVSAYGWLLSYFLITDTTETQILEMPLETYVAGMRNNSIPKTSFWYVDGSFRPFALGPEDVSFLAEHFVLKRTILNHDAWAHHYVSKVKPVFDGTLDLQSFKPANFDSNGSLLFFENGASRSQVINLAKGKYMLKLKGNSVPATPINGENAHLRIKLNGLEIASFFLSEDVNKPEINIPFECSENKKARIQLIFDNDLSVGNQDRNVVIYSLAVVPQ